MKRYAILFAGQGAQTIGMGLQTLTQSPSLNPYFQTIQKHLPFDLKAILSGDQPGLNQTEFTQPALLATSLLYFQQLQTEIPLNASYYLGFSLGEYTALHASGHLDLASTFHLIQIRANAMAKAGQEQPGLMAAIIGMQTEELNRLCQQVNQPNQIVIIANYNCPGQLVISGHQEAVKQVMNLALQHGAKRAIALNVSGAFHSPLMKPAASALANVLPKIKVNPSKVPMIFNWTGKPLPNLNSLPQHLIQQVQSSVLFESSIRYLAQEGIQHFLEIGPGNVLSGFVKKILPDAIIASYNGLNDLKMVKEFLA